jgi:hypothetical protein
MVYEGLLPNQLLSIQICSSNAKGIKQTLIGIVNFLFEAQQGQKIVLVIFRQSPLYYLGVLILLFLCLFEFQLFFSQT